MSSQLIQKVNAHLRNKGYRQSLLRDNLISILDLSDEPISVLEILKQLSILKITPNKTSVYRELETLLKNEIITELDFGERKKRYELTNENSRAYFICEKCDTIAYSKLNVTIESWLASFSSQNNFQTKDFKLQFYGLCSKCSDSNQN